MIGMAVGGERNLTIPAPLGFVYYLFFFFFWKNQNNGVKWISN